MFGSPILQMYFILAQEVKKGQQIQRTHSYFHTPSLYADNKWIWLKKLGRNRLQEVNTIST